MKSSPAQMVPLLPASTIGALSMFIIIESVKFPAQGPLGKASKVRVTVPALISAALGI